MCLRMHSYFHAQHSLTLNCTHADTSLNLKKKGVCEDLALYVGKSRTTTSQASIIEMSAMVDFN